VGLRDLRAERGHHRRARRHLSWADKPGFFVGPCLLDGVEPGMKAYDDEIFGPVLGVSRVASYAEAVDHGERQSVRQTACTIFTRDGQHSAALLARSERRG